MDVWADSGLSFECVGAERPTELQAPVELYLEGSDQHRGWFHSSLLMSEALYERAPYKGVLTHGFTVDEKGRKMSKSLGNVVAPQKVMSTLGADILRLWVAATDYANEISVSDTILKHMADSYRRMRNTFRYLLGSLNGFDPEQHQVKPADMVALDRWALSRARAVHEEVVEAYRKYEFHTIYQKVHNFCVVDLGGIYLDVIEGPHVHHAGGERRPPLRADRDVSHRRSDGSLARADPFVHGGRDVEVPARQARGVGVPYAPGIRCRMCRTMASTGTSCWSCARAC